MLNMKTDNNSNNMNPNNPYCNSNLFQLLLQPSHHHSHVSGSPISRASLQSEFSSSSSYSNGFYSSGDSSPYSPFEEAKCHAPLKHYMNVGGLWLDSKLQESHFNEILGDDLGLAESFYRMNIGDEYEGGGVKRRGFERDPNGFGLGGGGGFLGGNVPWGVENYGLFESSRNNMLDVEAFQSSHYGGRGGFNGYVEPEFLGLGPEYVVGDSMGGILNHMQQASALCCGPSGVKNQMEYMLEQRKELRDDWYNRNVQVENLARPYLDDAFIYSQLCGTDSHGGKGLMYPMSSPQFPSVAQLCVDNGSHNYHPVIKQRTRGNPTRKCAGHPEGFRGEDSLAVQGKHLHHGVTKGCKSSKANKKSSCSKMAMRTEGEKSSRLDLDSYNGGNSGNECSQTSNDSLKSVLALGSLTDVQGYIYFLAKDQHGCRFLQKMLDEGTRQDVQLIFDRIINHVLELMTDPFGNYLMQKFLDMCNEQQRMQFVLKVTKEPGQLVTVSLDTHGTRVVQKLIETVDNGKQVSLIIASLECGFLNLIKDPNGNHVVQRCLDCFSIEANRFIFDAAARFCVEIATQRHGCCVLQKCIAHASGRHRDKLLTEVSRNGLILSQDRYGNYVVQYVLELKIPSVMARLISQLKGHFVLLSMQKCSSHVVEKCLKHYEESRVKVIHELLSVSHFEQLLQDPYANYVIQSALSVTKGPLHAVLVEAVTPHTILRHSPYCKRIFTKDLLKK
ncbi:putative pumilio homolog 7, chloroplastic [Argentina anserina]|uniref:putative pumilio homolog 7, chloroplastic n=1 Tax=Argentina anserina TaxID=57926 RepID=UPI0021766E0E|nr:putative pumilio homolog 7, chloroplastic [Potentilla anserina]